MAVVLSHSQSLDSFSHPDGLILTCGGRGVDGQVNASSRIQTIFKLIHQDSSSVLLTVNLLKC